MLGEHNRTGKNIWHAWNQMTHIPLMVHLPGSRLAGERRNQLTQNIDIMPTVLEYFGLPCEAPVQGISWKRILEDNADSGKTAALYGWFGQTVNITDGNYTYFRAPAVKENQPLYRYFLTPKGSYHDMCSKDFYEEAEIGRFLPYTDYPVIKARVRNMRSEEWEDNRLYDIGKDYEQTVNLAGSEVEERYRKLLIKTLRAYDAPSWQFERLGLSGGGGSG
jgi:arylsulfatase A-like enzyme